MKYCPINVHCAKAVMVNCKTTICVHAYTVLFFEQTEIKVQAGPRDTVDILCSRVCIKRYQCWVLSTKNVIKHNFVVLKTWYLFWFRQSFEKIFAALLAVGDLEALCFYSTFENPPLIILLILLRFKDLTMGLKTVHHCA